MSQISLVEKPRAFEQAMTDSKQTSNQMKTMPKNTTGPLQKSYMQEFPSFTQTGIIINFFFMNDLKMTETCIPWVTKNHIQMRTISLTGLLRSGKNSLEDIKENYYLDLNKSGE